MNFFKNKFFFLLAFAAAAVFLSISLGGEFLHEHIHHHATEKEHDECPIHQLALQLFFVTLFLS